MRMATTRKEVPAGKQKQNEYGYIYEKGWARWIERRSLVKVNLLLKGPWVGSWSPGVKHSAKIG